MFHNIKTDIIYYRTATDFELEFNLCGCCRMRLLNDKMQDKKSFVHSLARAVSRSSVIIIAGPLFDEEGSIKTVAEAINTSTELVDNASFGISGDSEIEIIKGSTPLVTPDGYFGGCIIESGPQTMILLTDNKNIRKTIMKNLIHPYIEELYANEKAEQSEQVTESEIIIDSDQEELITETEEEITEPETEEEIADQEIEQPQIIIHDEDDLDQQDYQEDTADLFFEPTKLDRRKAELYTSNYALDSDDYSEDDYYTPKKSSKNILALSVFIISIILLLVIAVLCYCIFLVPAKQGIAPVAYLQDIFTTMFG